MLHREEMPARTLQKLEGGPRLLIRQFLLGVIRQNDRWRPTDRAANHDFLLHVTPPFGNTSLGHER